MNKKLSFVTLPTLPYTLSLNLQKSLSLLKQDLLILTSHPPSYTLGRNTPPCIKSLPAPLIKSDRGGNITFHGPGQLISYPLMGIRDWGVRGYVCKLESVLIKVCESYGVQATRTDDTGVWILNPPRKIAQLGIKVQNGRSSHGTALNVSVPLSYFDHIDPCGIVGKGVTNLEVELGRRVGMDEVRGRYIEAFGEVFGREMQEAEECGDVRRIVSEVLEKC